MSGYSPAPPNSSIPACLAVKAAGLQSPLAAEKHLREVAEALPTENQAYNALESGNPPVVAAYIGDKA